ncbi:lytic transglycosylase domain-containing protein [Escherichia coli]|uniref:lytic transglycosylase domain-containing protein n=1 Tax=Escherichia coli TaxID=562 RepID=UPI001C47BED9|nr:lytic transglycosylase domain-containing protein [Escherichia coli]EHH6699319.1 lytic transglycosylase domain-containing protein [Escherichia coli]EIC9951932.1 lytic transglycosylase domain-containing protein [Escherichia coli]MBV7011188.1 lytic transglycosylase domain-containing protein [Escherichia coli]
MANYRDLLEQAGARYGVPEGLMTALGAKESSYNPAAVSSAGAVGLTQVMPGTWRDMGYTDEQMQNPEYQADAGARYLAKMYQQFGNWRDALQAYHDGPGNVMKAKRGEYTPGPEGRGYVDDRFAQWAGDPVTDSTVEQRATSAKVHPQQDPNNPFAQLEAQSSEQVSASGVQSDPNNPFAQIEQQAASQQPPQPVSSVAPKPVQQQGGIMSDLGNGLAETGRGLLQAGINVANIPAELTDAVTSAAAWAGGKLGIGDGTYQPAPRVTTQGLEQDFGLQQGALTPQTTEGRVFAEALPYLTPAGVERAAAQAPTLAGRIAQGATRLLAENAVGSLAANSAKDDAEALATDLGVGVLTGGAINAAGRGLGAAYRGVRGAIAPEAQQAIRFAEREGVPLHTTDLLQPTSRVGKMAQTTAENIPLAGTSGMRATQQEARSQLVQRFADKFGEYDPAVVIDSLKAKTSGIRRAAGNRLEQVQNAMAGVNIQPARAIQQIDTEISNLQKLGKVADNETISKLQSYRDELVRNAGPDGPVNLDLKQLSDLRSQFRMDVKGERPVLPNRSDAAIQRVYKAMTDDINGAIDQNLGNDTLRKYQQANAVYADEAAKLKNTRLKNVLMKGDLTPEVVNNMLFSKNKSEIKTLYNSVGRVGRAQMRNGIIGKAMEKSGGSPDQFLRQLNILQNQTGITFKGQEAAYLKGLKNYLQSTQQAAKAAVTTPTGQQTIPFIIGYGTAMNPATTGAAVSYGLLTRAYESEPFRNAMLRMANTPRGSTAFEKAMQQAQKAINALTQGAKSDALSE